MRILVSKPDSLGDQLLIARHLQALAAANPQAFILWHVRTGMEVVASLLAGVAVFVPNLQESPAREAERLSGLHDHGLVLVPVPLHPFADWTSATEAGLAWWQAFLAAQSWDAAVAAVGNRTWVAEATVASSRAPRRIGAAATTARQIPVNAAGAAIAQCTPLFTVEVPFDPESPEDDLLHHLLAALPLALPGASSNRVILRLPPPAGRQSRQVILAPGVGGPFQRAWPASRFMEIEARLHTQGWSTLFVEGPSDADFLRPIREAGRSTSIRTLAPGDLCELAGLLQQSGGLICNDTAYAHLAALLDVPTIGIYGGGQRQRFHPQTGRVKIVQGIPPCAGCQWHCVYEKYPCVADIPVDAVWDAWLGLNARQDTSTVTFVPPWSAVEGGNALVSRLQREILLLDADRFARLQIIQTLLEQQRIRSAAPPPSSTPPPAPPPPLVTVVVPMGRPATALPTLDALAQQVAPDDCRWDVVVAGAGDAAIPSAHPGLSLKRALLPARVPPSQARNAGVALARGRWLLFIDDDIQPAPDFMACAAAIVRQVERTRPGVAAIGARLPGRHGNFWERVTDFSNFWSQQDRVSRECNWLYSAAMLVRADAFRSAGGFDPQLAVGEDVDLCRRLAAQGWTMAYEPSLVAYHDHQRNTAFRTWRYFWKNGEGARFFFRSIGGTCPFSIKTAWLKTWSDFHGNRDHQKRYGGKLGWFAPAVWLNYLIVEVSLEWHWQRHLRDGSRYRSLPARARSDLTAARALAAFDADQPLRGICLYALAVLQDFANPVRR